MDASTGWNFVDQQIDTYPYIDPSKADLKGKYVLITGASRGIGKAIAISYGKAGASGIAIVARSDLSKVADEIVLAAADAGRSRPHVLQIKCDATSEEDVGNTANEVESSFGKLDILINNAGLLEEFKPLASSDPLEWWKTFDVNVRGVYLFTRAFIPLLLKGGDKTILQMSSIGALATIPGGSSYEITKLAVLRLNDFLNLEYGDQGLLAYGIHPGGVATELAKGMPDFMHKVLTDTPELSGDSIVWLTKEKREWLAGRYVSVQWNMEKMLARKDEIVEKELLKVRLRV